MFEVVSCNLHPVYTLNMHIILYAHMHTPLHTQIRVPLVAVIVIWTLALLISAPFAWALSKAQPKLPVGTHFAPSALIGPLHRVPTLSVQCARLQLLKRIKVVCNIETNHVKYADCLYCSMSHLSIKRN